MAHPRAIIKFLGNYLAKNNLPHLKPAEANELLEKNELLDDEEK